MVRKMGLYYAPTQGREHRQMKRTQMPGTGCPGECAAPRQIPGRQTVKKQEDAVVWEKCPNIHRPKKGEPTMADYKLWNALKDAQKISLGGAFSLAEQRKPLLVRHPGRLCGAGKDRVGLGQAGTGMPDPDLQIPRDSLVPISTSRVTSSRAKRCPKSMM